MANTKITSRVLADNAVLTANITDANVTTAKVADNAVTGDKVADDVALAGNPTTTTQSAGNNTTRIATTAFVSTAVANLADSAPDALNTLNELAAAMGDDANFSTTITNSIAAKLPLAGGTMTGDLILGDNVKLEVGSASGGDLQIYHDGSNSYIDDAGTGDLIINATALRPRTDLFVLNNAANNKNQIVAQSGAIKLFYDGAEQLETVSGAVKINNKLGIGVTPTHNFNLQSAGNVEARFRSTDGDCSLQISSDTDEGQSSELNFMSGTSGRGAIVYDHNTTAASQSMTFKTGDLGVSAMTILGNGKVGIGRTPTKSNVKLEIGGADNVALIQLEASSNFGGFGIGSNALNMYYNDNKFMYINNLGDVYIPSGNLHIGSTASIAVAQGGIRLVYPSNEPDGDLFFTSNGGGSNATPVLMYVVSGEGFNSSHGAMAVGRHTGNSRSINAGGTINASGADYAEYMVKSSGCGDIAKGDVVGVDADGKLTKTFSAAKSFVIKSTDPSYVGGDTWWTEKEPEPKYTDDTKSTKTDNFKDWETRMETARGTVDRIAFSGQVPVNITGSFNVGDYVYPQVNSSGIKAVAKSSPTFEEYQLCVGKIWTTMDDGRPLVAVKIG